MKIPSISRFSVFRRYLKFSFASLVFAMPPVAQASLLFYEGFNGYAVGGIGGQSPNANTVGINQTVAYGGNTPASSVVSASGLAFGSLQTSGGSITVASGTTVVGASLSLSTTPYTGTLWSSYLVNFTSRGAATGDGFEIRASNNQSSTTNARFHAYADSRVATGGTASTAIGVDYSGTTFDGPVSGDPSLTLGTTYIMISSFTNVGNTGATGVATTYALTQAQFLTMMASPLGADAYLASATVAGGQISAFVTDSSVVTATDTFKTGDFVQFVSVGENVQYDEIRYGSTLGDVIPLVPEPSAVVLAALGCVGMAIRRRRA